MSSTSSSEYFQAFVQYTPYLWDFPTQLTENRQHYLYRFFSRIVALHASPESACFAATETFAMDYEGTPCVMALLAVLRDQFDIFLPRQIHGEAKCRNEIIIDFTFLPITNQTTSAPLTWWVSRILRRFIVKWKSCVRFYYHRLEIQTLGSHFRSERMKRAAWALGQLRPGSHAPDSASFKWVRQIWSREPLR